jgi:hypothetical protein
VVSWWEGGGSGCGCLGSLGSGLLRCLTGVVWPVMAVVGRSIIALVALQVGYNRPSSFHQHTTPRADVIPTLCVWCAGSL